MNKILATFVFYMLSFCAVKAQVTFVKTISDTTRNIYAYSVIQKNDGNYYLSGSVSDSISASTFLMKCDPIGNVIWTKKYEDGSFYNSAKELINGDLVLCGFSALAKTDSSGNLLWTREFTGGNPVELQSVNTTSDGGFILVGTQNLGANSVLELIKLDVNGQVVWSKESDLSVDFFGSIKVVELIGGGFVIAGSNWLASTQIRTFVLKTDTIGNVIWSKKIFSASNLYVTDILQDVDHGFTLSGVKGNKPCLIRIDSTANIIWAFEYNSNVYSRTTSEILRINNKYIVSGVIADTAAYYYNRMYIMSVDQNGTFEFLRTYDAIINAMNVAFSHTNDNGYVLVGGDGIFDPENPPSSIPSSIRLIKTDSLFETACNSRSVYFFKTAAVLTKTNGFNLIPGSIISSILNVNQSIYNWNFTTNCTSLSVEENARENSVSVYPNPFTSEFVLSNTLKTGHIDIYNVLGMKVVSQRADNETTRIICEQLSKGIYFLNYSEKDLFITRKIIKE